MDALHDLLVNLHENHVRHIVGAAGGAVVVMAEDSAGEAWLASCEHGADQLFVRRYTRSEVSTVEDMRVSLIAT